MTKRTTSRATQYAVAVAKNQALNEQLKRTKPQRPTALWDKLNKTLTNGEK